MQLQSLYNNIKQLVFFWRTDNVAEEFRINWPINHFGMNHVGVYETWGQGENHYEYNFPIHDLDKLFLITSRLKFPTVVKKVIINLDLIAMQ